MPELKKCPFCAEEINAEAIKCKHCSSDLSATSAPVKKKGRGCLMNGVIVIAVIFGILFVLGLIGSIGSKKSDSTSNQSDSNSSSSSNSNDGPQPKCLNESFTLDGIQYTLLKDEMAMRIGDSDMLGAKAPKGSLYVIITYSVENKKDETATIITDNIKLVTGDHKIFSSDSKANTALMYQSKDDKDFLLSQLQPGIKQTTKTAFLAPEKSLKEGYAIEFPSTDIFSSEKQLVFPLKRSEMTHKRTK